MLELSDSKLDRAHDEMTAARRRLGGYRSPCMDDPTLFDPQDGERGESYVQFHRRASVAKILCESSCRVLWQCQALRDADSRWQGVMAGELFIPLDDETEWG